MLCEGGNMINTNLSNTIQTIHNHKTSFIETKQNIKNKYLNLDKERDLRISCFTKCISVLNSTYLFLGLIQKYVSNKNWWIETSKVSMTDRDINNHLVEFEMFIKIGFLQSFFSAIESSLRIFLYALDSNVCDGSTSAFKNIYSSLFKRLKIQQHEALLDLLRLIRNVIHHNGVFLPNKKENVLIDYKGKQYLFEVGKLIKFAKWGFLMDLLPEIKNMLIDIISSDKIESIDSIIDFALSESPTPSLDF